MEKFHLDPISRSFSGFLLLNGFRLSARALVHLHNSKIFQKSPRRSLIYGQNNMQTWGLIVLLVSKMAGHAKGILESEQDKSAGVSMSQRTLAEVVEMVRTANMIHSSGVLNLQHLQKSGNDLSFDSDLIFGNKIALLGGDILLGNASTQMAQLK
jgi:decaprenyl-diphosphate synthase subunit 2